MGAPKEWRTDHFLDFDEVYVQGAIHGAWFRIDDGFGSRSPGADASYASIAVDTRAGEVVVRLD